MSHLDLGTPGAPKLSNILVCDDGTCGRCLRCTSAAELRNYQALVAEVTRNAVAQMTAEAMALEAQVKAQDALLTIQREFLRTMAVRIDSEDAKAQIQDMVAMTPEAALASLAPAPEAAGATND